MLNAKYYRELWEKYKNVPALPGKLNGNWSWLTIKMILDCYRGQQPIHINSQNLESQLVSVCQHLFIELANDIYCTAADFPPLNVGDKVRSRTPIRVGTPKPRFLDFEITRIHRDRYTLENKKFSFNWEKSFSELVERFIPINHGVQNETLTGFTSFFEHLNNKSVHDFAPTFFDRKCVFIGKKALWDQLEAKNRIPATYLPYSKEDGNSSELKSIPALPDSMIYFASKYEVCYQKVLLQRKNIKSIVIFDTEEEKIAQMIQDRSQFGFNIIMLTNTLDPIKNDRIPCWNWFAEEIEILNSL
ncbi:MAG: hypothetical protein J0H74_04155 [Chitinophagaceae bacterium]|nr:hypothetical protein [Chitinophagaceae bacterium]